MNFFCKYFGHKFRPRYNCEESKGEVPNGFWSPALMYGNATVAIINATKSKKETYIYDICIRCGEKIIRN